jgi:chromosome segregation ATPase
MKSVEPVFDFPEDFYPAGSGASETDIRALEDTIARQSSELNLRLTEILDLYNIQARQTDALQVAREEIERLKRTVSELRNAMAEQGTAAVANQEEIKRLKKDRASLSTQRALALLETETMADRMHAMQATPQCRGSECRIGACADRQPELRARCRDGGAVQVCRNRPR